MKLRRIALLLGLSATASGLQVTVAGGSGFVGSRVCKYLVENGAEVTSVSKSGKVPDWAARESWSSQVKWVANDMTRGEMEGLVTAVGTPEAFVSCVGSVGFDRQGLLVGNGKANVDICKALTKVGTVQRISYVSASEELFDLKSVWTYLGFFLGYFDGKRLAEAAFNELAPGRTTIVRPTFIYGGDSFGIAPPRVTAEYGAGVEKLLSGPPFKQVAGLMPGLIKIALRPPVSVDAVAAAAARAALGKIEPGDLQGEAIGKAADLPVPAPLEA